MKLFQLGKTSCKPEYFEPLPNDANSSKDSSPNILVNLLMIMNDIRLINANSSQFYLSLKTFSGFIAVLIVKLEKLLKLS